MPGASFGHGPPCAWIRKDAVDRAVDPCGRSGLERSSCGIEKQYGGTFRTLDQHRHRSLLRFARVL